MVLHLGGNFLNFLAWLRAKRLLSDWMLVKVWAAEFKCGRKSLGDDERSGRLNTATADETIAKVHQMVKDNHRIKVREIAEVMNMSKEHVCHILNQHLGMRKLSTRRVPRLLTQNSHFLTLHGLYFSSSGPHYRHDLFWNTTTDINKLDLSWRVSVVPTALDRQDDEEATSRMPPDRAMSERGPRNPSLQRVRFYSCRYSRLFHQTGDRTIWFGSISIFEGEHSGGSQGQPTTVPLLPISRECLRIDEYLDCTPCCTSILSMSFRYSNPRPTAQQLASLTGGPCPPTEFYSISQEFYYIPVTFNLILRSITTKLIPRCQ
ncbi:histone-lysine N-methyltransferase SETMAR [Trichonephila clavipes]|nr:histone-lysine N-methyltransferase SETMAR [Trichonephila clavipes]